MDALQTLPAEPLWLETGTEVDEWLAAVPSGTPVGIDSEFERTSTFYAIPGLVQLAAGTDVRLVEPAAAAASERFRSLLEDPEHWKLLYAMSEDLELFREWLGVQCRSVIDLQIAGAFCGYGLSAGYVTVVSELMGVALSKDETRSDWLQRPLSPAQQHYAVADVYYLAPLHDRLSALLKDKGLVEAMHEESARMAARLGVADDPERYYLRLRGGWRLSPGRQAVLRRLCAWREARCRALDRPRNRVASDSVLLATAERLPKDRQALAAVPDMPAGLVRREGQSILGVIDDVINGEHTSIEPIPKPLTKKEQQCFRAVKGLVRDILSASGVPLELVAPRRYLEPAVREGLATGGVPPLFIQGWRARFFRDRLDEMESLFNE